MLQGRMSTAVHPFCSRNSKVTRDGVVEAQQGKRNMPTAFHYHHLLDRATTLSDLDGFRVMAFLFVSAIPFVWIMKKPVFESSVE